MWTNQLCACVALCVALIPARSRHCSVAPAFRYKPARRQPLTTQHSIIDMTIASTSSCVETIHLKGGSRRQPSHSTKGKTVRHTVDIRLTDNTIIIRSCTINTFICHYRSLTARTTGTGTANPYRTAALLPYICPTQIKRSLFTINLTNYTIYPPILRFYIVRPRG